MHSKNIAHCDIKLANILVDGKFNVCYADFGGAKPAD
jgi:serine/threonine protein kinase